MFECAFKARCPTKRCGTCLLDWHEIIGQILDPNPDPVVRINSVIDGDPSPVNRPLNACVHLGSKRRCCDSLFICRQSPGTDCILTGPSAPPLRSCELCSHFEPLNGVDMSATRAPVAEFPKQPGAFAGRCNVITSLSPNPHRRGSQLHCLQTWINYGLTPVVLNTQEEISRLNLPPEVVSVVSDDIATIYRQAPQRISALIRFGIDAGLPFMLLNADIAIHGEQSILEDALIQPEKLTIGVRHNYSEHSSPVMESHGLDCFLMTPKLAATLPEMPFGLGKPFWDYWLPYHFRQIGVQFNWIRRPFFYHEYHQTHWSKEEWDLGCNTFRDEYGEDMSETSDEFRRSLDECIVTAPES